MRKSLGLAALTLAYVLALSHAACARQSAGAKGQRAEAGEPGEGVFALRNLLYCDKTLDEVVRAFGSTTDKVLRRASALVGAGDYGGAVKLLLGPETRAGLESQLPYAYLLAAAQRGAGDLEAARRAVRPLLAEEESRVVLQAWTILRELGERPPPSSADVVLGVVVEMGTADGAVSIAGYADGTARYFTSRGGRYTGEPNDEKLRRAARALPQAAGALAGTLPSAAAPRFWPKAGRVRITALTAGGSRLAEEAASVIEREGHGLHPTYLSAHLLLTEMRRVMK
jgi:hypothetical protein